MILDICKTCNKPLFFSMAGWVHTKTGSSLCDFPKRTERKAEPNGEKEEKW